MSVAPAVQGRPKRLLATEDEVDGVLLGLGRHEVAARVLAGVALAGAGVGLGYLIGNETAEGTTITQTSPSSTEVVIKTATGPTTTVEEATTETHTETETQTVTETETVGG